MRNEELRVRNVGMLFYEKLLLDESKSIVQQYKLSLLTQRREEV